MSTQRKEGLIPELFSSEAMWAGLLKGHSWQGNSLCKGPAGGGEGLVFLERAAVVGGRWPGCVWLEGRAGVRAGQGPSRGAQEIQVLCGTHEFVEQREKVCAHVTVVLKQGPQQQGGKQGPKGLPLESGLPGGG